MATLAPGSTVTIPVTGLEVFTVSSSTDATYFKGGFTAASATASSSGNAKNYGPMRQNVTFGPYNTPGTLTLSVDSGSNAGITYSQTGGFSVPYILAQSAVQSILVPTGTSNATGQITLGTALGATPNGTVQIYLPAGVVTAGSAGTGAGLYPVVFSSTTVCQIQGTGIVTANAAYTQTASADLTLASVTLPAGVLGANGAVRGDVWWTCNNTANTKVVSAKLSGTILGTRSAASQTGGKGKFEAVNRGSQAVQWIPQSSLVTAPYGDGTNSSVGAIDTSQAQTIAITANIATNTDFIILEGYSIEVLPLQ